jgi:hypothetical protein
MDHGVKRAFTASHRTCAYALAYTIVAAIGMAVAALPAAAQVRGLPVYNAGVPRGIGLSADVGFPNDDAGNGLGFGVSGSAGIGLVGVTATLGAYNPDGAAGNKVTVGGTVNYRVFGGPLIPLAVTLQGGVGYYKPDVDGADVSELHVPVGVGFALTVPNPALAIKPWLAPRLDIVRHKVETGGVVGVSNTDTDTEFGISGGVELNFLNGFGIHAAYDLVTGSGSKPGVFGVGAHYALRLPVP